MCMAASQGPGALVHRSASFPEGALIVNRCDLASATVRVPRRRRLTQLFCSLAQSGVDIPPPACHRRRRRTPRAPCGLRMMMHPRSARMKPLPSSTCSAVVTLGRRTASMVGDVLLGQLQVSPIVCGRRTSGSSARAARRSGEPRSTARCRRPASPASGRSARAGRAKRRSPSTASRNGCRSIRKLSSGTCTLIRCGVRSAPMRIGVGVNPSRPMIPASTSCPSGEMATIEDDAEFREADGVDRLVRLGDRVAPRQLHELQVRREDVRSPPAP